MPFIYSSFDDPFYYDIHSLSFGILKKKKTNTIYTFWDQHKKVWGFLDNEKRRDFFWLFKKIEKKKEKKWKKTTHI